MYSSIYSSEFFTFLNLRKVSHLYIYTRELFDSLPFSINHSCAILLQNEEAYDFKGPIWGNCFPHSLIHILAEMGSVNKHLNQMLTKVIQQYFNTCGIGWLKFHSHVSLFSVQKIAIMKMMYGTNTWWLLGVSNITVHI